MLTQAEADQLLATRKWFPPGIAFSISAGQARTYELESDEAAETFVLDTYRGRIALKKVKLQNRVRSSIVLARLDLDGAPHTNPDGQRIDCPHLQFIAKATKTGGRSGLIRTVSPIPATWPAPSRTSAPFARSAAFRTFRRISFESA